MTTKTVPAGWGWPLSARFEHFFIEDASVCGRWQRDRETLSREHVNGPPTCPVCQGKAVRL